jgi:hypothetical protein
LRSLTLDKSDETGVQLTLAPPAELTGRLTIDGDAAAAAQHAVRLAPSSPFENGGGGDAEVPPGVADASGGFLITGVSSRRYRVAVDPMPENGYIASVTVGRNQ